MEWPPHPLNGKGAPNLSCISRMCSRRQLLLLLCATPVTTNKYWSLLLLCRHTGPVGSTPSNICAGCKGQNSSPYPSAETTTLTRRIRAGQGDARLNEPQEGKTCAIEKKESFSPGSLRQNITGSSEDLFDFQLPLKRSCSPTFWCDTAASFSAFLHNQKQSMCTTDMLTRSGVDIRSNIRYSLRQLEQWAQEGHSKPLDDLFR